jgi:hypothetical protein
MGAVRRANFVKQKSTKGGFLFCGRKGIYAFFFFATFFFAAFLAFFFAAIVLVQVSG